MFCIPFPLLIFLMLFVKYMLLNILMRRDRGVTNTKQKRSGRNDDSRLFSGNIKFISESVALIDIFRELSRHKDGYLLHI
jgi:hypothetical protein